MIELLWTNNLCVDYEVMMYAAGLMSWLASLLAQDEENHSVEFNGFMVAKEEKGGCAVVIICGNPQSQKRVLEIVQQPPEEYKGKYIASIPSEEPEPVNEMKTEEDDTYKIEIADET